MGVCPMQKDLIAMGVWPMHKKSINHHHPHHPLLRQPQPHDDARHRQHKDGGGGGDGFDDGHYHQLLALKLTAI